MEIQGIPFNKEKSYDRLRWLRIQIVQSQQHIKVMVLATRENQSVEDSHFLYETSIDKEQYLEI